MRIAAAPTLEIVINPWCPRVEIELVEAAVISRPTRVFDVEVIAAFARFDPETEQIG